jgi:hypothetical protein
MARLLRPGMTVSYFDLGVAVPWRFVFFPSVVASWFHPYRFQKGHEG